MHLLGSSPSPRTLRWETRDTGRYNAPLGAGEGTGESHQQAEHGGPSQSLRASSKYLIDFFACWSFPDVTSIQPRSVSPLRDKPRIRTGKAAFAVGNMVGEQARETGRGGPRTRWSQG